MSEKPNNPPAFPHEDMHDVRPGMTLRDWFAGQAMTGMLAHSTRYRPREGAPANWHEAIAEEAFQIADALLSHRAKGE